VKGEKAKKRKSAQIYEGKFSQKNIFWFFINFTWRKVKAAGKNVEKILFRGKFSPFLIFYTVKC
jgi:hypothetical protein